MSSGLSGIRVLDLGWAWAGPFAAMILADLGADVLKLESATRIDRLRLSGPFSDNVMHHERSGFFGICNRGKKSFTLNLKHPRARSLVLDLVARCDVVVENFAPRVLPSLGIDASALRERNPRLVVLRMSGYGATGPERDYVSYGDHLLYAAGAASVTGADGDPPTQLGISYGDPVGGLYGALAVLAALRDRERSGRGTTIELSQVEGVASLLATSLMATDAQLPVMRTVDKSPDMHPHGFYRCAGQDAWVAIAVRGDDGWRRFRDLLLTDKFVVPESPLLADRLAAAAEIDRVVAAWSAQQSPWTVTERCQRDKIAAFPVLTAPDLVFDDHLAARGFFPIVHRAVVGPAPVSGPLIKGYGCAASVKGPAPLLGEHNDYVFKQVLELTDEAYGQGLAEGLIA